jgi:parallel beta-helix repeat protein
MTNSAYFGSAIALSGKSYITINGGTNGLIQNTGNGTGLAYANPSGGIGVTNGSYITVENLTVANICQHTSSSDLTGCVIGGNGDGGISFNGTTNVTVQNNTVHDSKNCIFFEPAAGTAAILASGNTAYHCNWGIAVGVATTSGVVTGIQLSNNNVYDAYNWDTTTDYFHNDGIFVFNSPGASGITGVIINNNYVHGNFGADNTSFIYVHQEGGSIAGTIFYNNIIINGPTHYPGDPFIWENSTPGPSYYYNNTIFGNGGGYGIGTNYQATLVNNVISGVRDFIWVNTVTTADYNQYMNLIPSGCHGWSYGGGPCSGQSTFAAWQTACSCDSHGAYNSANTINANGTPQAGSPVIRAGTNLTSLSIAALDSDYAGRARPPTGAWDIGAYEAPSPNPPVRLGGSAR